MITDVDELTRCFDTMSSQYTHIVLLLSNVDHQSRPSAYTDIIIGCDQAVKIVINDSSRATLLPILTNSTIKGYIGSLECNFILKDNSYVPTISSARILLHSAIPLILPFPPSDVCQDSVSKKLISMASTKVIH